MAKSFDRVFHNSFQHVISRLLVSPAKMHFRTAAFQPCQITGIM